MKNDYIFKAIDTDENDILRISELLQIVFKNPSLFTFDYLTWQYSDNPNGKVIGFNAFYDGLLTAHYATIPVKSIIGGQIVAGLLSLNTATHPEHQGQKLFTRLADKTYNYASELGYKYVVGVANQNSTHGFVKNLGFTLIAPLEAKIFSYLPKFPSNTTPHFQRFWDDDLLKWRLGNPSEKYSYSDSNDNGIFIFSKTKCPGIKALIGHIRGQQIFPFSQQGLFNLWIGIDNSICWQKSSTWNIPPFFKSSPLNLIFKSLVDDNFNIDKENLSFWVMDFDAY